MEKLYLRLSYGRMDVGFPLIKYWVNEKPLHSNAEALEFVIYVGYVVRKLLSLKKMAFGLLNQISR